MNPDQCCKNFIENQNYLQNISCSPYCKDVIHSRKPQQRSKILDSIKFILYYKNMVFVDN